MSPAEYRQRRCVDFALFILVTAILFIRSADFGSGLEGANLYLIASFPFRSLYHKLRNLIRDLLLSTFLRAEEPSR